jgi:peptidoglycan/LPS O-acetylase OafA/YrhL
MPAASGNSLLQLRRITSSGRFVPEIDGLRFAAISSVVLYHFLGFVAGTGVVAEAGDGPRAIQHGYRGVNLFYVISGFVLGLPFAAHRLKAAPAVSLRSYFLRRLTRLEPPYALSLLICFALLVTQGASAGSLLPSLSASLLYIHNFWFGQQSSVNPVAWTLEIEVQFYCLAPLLASIFSVRPVIVRRSVLLGIIVLSGVLQAVYWDAPLRFKLSIIYAIQFFLAGFLLADVYLTDWQERPSSDWRWDLLSLAGWPLIFLLSDLQVWICLPFLMLTVYMATFRGILFCRFFRNTVVTTIGGMCYTIYLFHYVLIAPVLQATKNVGAGSTFVAYFIFQLLLYTPLLLAVGCTYFVLIERPCMERDWPQRLLLKIKIRSALKATWSSFCTLLNVVR